MKLSPREIARRFYRERALPHLIPFPARVAAPAADPLPEGLDTWEISSPIEQIDWWATLLGSSEVIPGVTTRERLIGQSTDWSRVDQFLISYVVEPAQAATVFASSFASALELVREGVAEIHQKESFSPIYMRKRVAATGGGTAHDAEENV